MGLYVIGELDLPRYTRCLLQQTQDTIAGITVSSQYKPRIDTDKFPVVDTRPMTNMVWGGN